MGTWGGVFGAAAKLLRGMPTAHVGVPGLGSLALSLIQLLTKEHLGRQQMMAPVAELPPFMWEIQAECQAAAYGVPGGGRHLGSEQVVGRSVSFS